MDEGLDAEAAQGRLRSHHSGRDPASPAIMYEDLDPVPPELTAEERSNGKTSRIDIAKYDRIRNKIKRENALKKKQLQEGLQQHAMVGASMFLSRGGVERHSEA